MTPTLADSGGGITGWLGFVAFILLFIGLTWQRRRRGLEVRRRIPVERPEELFYNRPVLARIRTDGIGQFVTFKNSFAGTNLTISSNAIRLVVNGPMKHVISVLALDIVLLPSDAAMTRTRMGWLGTSFFARDAVVVRGINRRRTFDVVVTPKDGDIGSLEFALSEAGVGKHDSLELSV